MALRVELKAGERIMIGEAVVKVEGNRKSIQHLDGGTVKEILVKDGDRVLWYWASFGPTGGPPTLVLQATKRRGCYRVVAQDDNGKRTAARGARLHADGRSVLARTGSGCLKAHKGLVTATLKGAVRSNALR